MIRLHPPEERRQRSLAMQAVHADWAADQIAAGLDGATPEDRPEPSDYNQHVPDMEADGDAVDDLWERLGEVIAATASRSLSPEARDLTDDDAPGPDDVEDDEDPDSDEIEAWANLADEDEAARAAGHDVTPGHDELHHWWTKGPGLKRWAGSPTPWRTLLANLVEAVKDKPLETLKKWTSRWYIEVFGYAAGSDKARVAHGKPPRGHVVGPG